MADDDRDRIHYEPVIQDTFMLGQEETIPAGCAICWAGCIPRANMGNFPRSWTWLSRMKVLTDESLLCVNDNSDQVSTLGHLPQPMRIGGVQTRLSSNLAHRGDTARRITRRAALCWFDNYFILPPADFLPEDQNDITSENLDDPVLETYALDGEFQPWFCLPVHDACLGLLEQFSRKRDGTVEQRNLVDLYDAVACSFQQWCSTQHYMKLRDTRNEFHETEFQSRPATGGRFFTFKFSYQALFRWELPWDSYFLADPLDIGMYTEALLLSAPRLLCTQAQTIPSNLDQPLNQLPQELLDLILEELCPFQDVPITCCRMLVPEFWRSLLVTPGVFPFLWDIDKELVMQASEDIDWEQFVRLLAQPDAFERLENPPRGLRDRHYIWQRLVASRSSADIHCEKHQNSNEEQADSPGCGSLGLDRLTLAETNQGLASGGSHGSCYTEVEVTWNRRTEEELELQDREDYYESGRWALKWRRLHSQE